MEKRRFAKELLHRFDPVALISPMAIVLLIILFTAINGNFIGRVNIADLLVNIAPLLAVAAGQMMVLLIGSIDLSVGSIVSCSSLIVAVTISDIGIFSFALALAFGLVAGFMNGLLVSKLKIPSFISTLTTMGVWQSVAYLIAPSSIMVTQKRWYLIQWGKVTFWHVLSWPFLLSVFMVITFYIMQTRTPAGRQFAVLGANERCARLAGVRAERIKIKAYMLSGLCASISGIFLLIKLRSGAPALGESIALLSIAAVCLGGAPLSGGKGNMLGTLLGVILVIVIQNGMTIVAVDAFWQNIVFGCLIIVSIYLTSDKRKSNVVVK